VSWSPVWEAFTAIGTVAMAATTVVVIFQNRRQHRDALRPICVLVPEKGTDAVGRRDALQLHKEPNDSNKYFSIACGVKNIGGGPAVKLRLRITFWVNTTARFEAELSPLGAHETVAGPLRIPVFVGNEFTQTEYEWAPGEGWDLWLEYEDLFGNLFHTRHTKTPQQPWVQIGNGLAPRATIAEVAKP